MNEVINKILWAVATAFILFSSLFFTLKLKGTQFNIKEILSSIKKSSNNDGLNSFEILMMTLAGRIGVGSIAGIALGIYVGGKGTLFWIWIIAILSSILAYAETVLGVLYNEKDLDDVCKGGPSYYIKNGLGLKWLGGLYSILILISYIGGFLGIQSNTIVKSVTHLININPYVVAVLVVLITGLIIFGGVKKIASSTSKIVPIMGIFYLTVVFYIIIINIRLVPKLIFEIISNTFSFKSFFGGFLTTFIVGIQRGIFSSEAGLGTGSIVSSASSDDSASTQGYIQILGVYITSLLICSATAFVILLSNYDVAVFEDINGIELVLYAFRYHLGGLGDLIVMIAIFLFSFSTILTGYYYGESSLKYFFEKIKPVYLFILKLVTLVILFIGGLLSPTFLWNIIDSLVAVLAIINIYALFKLKNDIIFEYRYYKSRKCDKI